MTKLNEKAYQNLIDGDKKELERWIPSVSIIKHHIIEVLDWSVREIYHSNDKIKVESDGVTKMVEPKDWDKWLKLALPLNEWSQDDSEYLIYQNAESITIQEHNKRLMNKVENDAIKIQRIMVYPNSLEKELNQANETITKHKEFFKGIIDKDKDCDCSSEASNILTKLSDESKKFLSSLETK